MQPSGTGGFMGGAVRFGCRAQIFVGKGKLRDEVWSRFLKLKDALARLLSLFGQPKRCVLSLPLAVCNFIERQRPLAAAVKRPRLYFNLRFGEPRKSSP